MNTPLLDHMVVNVHFDMDGAAQQFSRLGFELTPRGFHTLGSINHLMVFQSDYLELIGLPPGAGVRRPEIASEPLGLTGLVFKTDNVDETFEHLQTLGMAGDPPKSFSRSVVIGGVEEQACFRTVTVRPGVFAPGRVYFCEHQTPELVWYRGWQGHPNGVTATREFIVVANDPEAEAARYASLLSCDVASSGNGSALIDLTGSRLVLLDPARYAERFGALACKHVRRDSIFGGLSLQCTDLSAVREQVEACADICSVLVESDRLVVRVNEYDTLLEFVP